MASINTRITYATPSEVDKYCERTLEIVRTLKEDPLAEKMFNHEVKDMTLDQIITALEDTKERGRITVEELAELNENLEESLAELARYSKK